MNSIGCLLTLYMHTQTAVFVVLGTGLTDEVGQNSDMDNPGCDCLIVHWAVLNISLFSCNCTQSASGMPTSLRPAK